ncbi:MAG: ion channel [Thermodesulfobacteriota bacterium]|nr:ion channel [Thermodesulfobacteriota bacterium]
MQNIFLILKKIYAFLHKEKIDKILFFIIIVLLAGSLLLNFFEKNINFYDAAWWSIVTMATVGYGDISPESAGGRAVAVFVMFSGIGVLGILTASVASIFIENKFMEKKGMKKTDLLNHFIICGWNFRGRTIISEMREDPESKNIPIVIIADKDEKPDERDSVFFIHGDIDTDSLEKANAEKARAAIVLSDEGLGSYERDAKTILNTMTIKTVAPDLYTCVELMDAKNMAHCQMAKADEIIVVGELSTNLLVQAALDHGITRLVSELVSNQYGQELYKIEIPSYLVGNTFFQAMCQLKKEKNIICIGIEDKAGSSLMANPENSYILKKEDQIIAIALNRPEL